VRVEGLAGSGEEPVARTGFALEFVLIPRVIGGVPIPAFAVVALARPAVVRLAVFVFALGSGVAWKVVHCAPQRCDFGQLAGN
jgi:hypothetical protein